MSKSTTHDPRSIITPDAFAVDDALLGMPLASPGRRMAALLIDLATIGLVTLLTKSFALILGVVAAVFFMRAGFKRTPVKGSVFGRAMRLSVGCLGLFIALTTASLWAVFGFDFGGGDGGDGDADSVVEIEGLPVVVPGDLRGLLDGAGTAVSSVALSRASTLEDAENAIEALAQSGQTLGMSRSELHEMATDILPKERSWSDDAKGVIDRLLGDDADPPEAGAAAVLSAPQITAITNEVRDLSSQAALREYAASVDSPAGDAPESLRTDALRSRLASDLAGDSLEGLQDRVAGLERDVVRERRARNVAEAAIADDGGFFGGLRNFVDELGFGFGWASLYLTILLSWWNGQTVGKRLLGLRVVRLDGEPITWWIAFERAGGYAAGFATGLLGFAQIFWDANRQGIHDRIVGTAVVVEGAKRVEDWERAL